MDLKKLFEYAVAHRNEHDCSAYPYEDYERLVEAVNKFGAKKILEIGTGMGFTAAAMALQNPSIKIDTLEKDPEHATLAKQFLEGQGAGKQVKVINGVAEEVLSTFQSGYDLIFFDGYQIHYEFLPHYLRLLKPGGILFLANNHLQSKTSEQFFSKLNRSSDWKILEQFADTTVAERL